MDCPRKLSTDKGYGKGETFQEARSGEARAKRDCGPNVFIMTVSGEKGYVTVEVRRKADFHCM